MFQEKLRVPIRAKNLLQFHANVLRNIRISNVRLKKMK